MKDGRVLCRLAEDDCSPEEEEVETDSKKTSQNTFS